MTGVLEVAAQPELTAVPTSPDSLLGLFNLRGEIVPLFDLAVLLGLDPVDTTPFVAVVHTRSGPAGLVATGFPESLELAEPVQVDVVTGKAVYAVGSRVATLIDIDELLSPPRVSGWQR